MHERVSSTKRVFGWPRDKLLLILVWYSCMMSVGLVYIAHEKLHHTNAVHIVQRDNAPATPPSLKRWTRGFTNIKIGSSRPPAEAASSSEAAIVIPHGNVTNAAAVEIIEDTTTSFILRELAGYVNVIDNRPLQINCGQCAMVSSSGQLLQKGAGADIDQSECIVRMNSAPVRTYEEDVGRRTTIRVIGHVNLGKGIHNDTTIQEELFGDNVERPDIVIVPWLYAAPVNKTTDAAWKTAVHLSKIYPDVEFYVLTPKQMNYSEEVFRKEVGISRQEAHTWLSTGWMTMLFAMEACDAIDVYGLVEENHCKKHPNDSALYHYFEPDFRKECDYYQASEGMLRYGHKFITEKAIFAKWSLQKNIFFHYPSWTASESNTTLLDTPFLRTYREALRNGSLAELQSIPKKKVVRRKKKIIRVVRRKKTPLKTGDTIAGGGVGGGGNRIEETVLILNNSRDRSTIAGYGRDSESVKRAELMRLARRKIIRARKSKVATP